MERSQLMKMSKEQLDELFKQSEPGEIPNGEGTGTAVVFPGTLFARFLAWLTRVFFWQGKVFNAEAGNLKNRITPFSLRFIKAKVYKAPSWLDEKETIVLDYSKTSLVAHWIRDEIREVAPGLYLGKVWWGRKRLIDFIVSFRYEPARKFWRRAVALVCLVVLIAAVWFAVRLNSDSAIAYDNIEEHFKYGSTGGERASGLPYSVFMILPKVFADKLPGGYASLGFIYEKDENGNPRDLPIGFSKRKVQGVDRTFVNCAVCHVGSVRVVPESQQHIVIGMPSNTVDLEGFTRFLISCVKDERFTGGRLVPEIEQAGTEDLVNRLALRFVGIGLMRERLLTLGDRFRFLDTEPDCGPGRYDTFNPPKSLFNFPLDKRDPSEKIGLCDFPSIWNQRQRKGMHLHWDGNNDSVEERNRSAAFGTGATPPTLDRDNIKRIENFLLEAKPLSYAELFTIDYSLAAKGEPLYMQYCASCHGISGVDFSGKYVGQVTPIEEIKTDRWRLDSYTFELCINQNLLYANFGDERFSHFRKTFGYANSPLDGLWLRAPYLHNGSVPTVRDLLEPGELRPKEFYRGNDVYDPKRMGFVSAIAEEGGRKFFRFDTSLPGNGKLGHEGYAYGTQLRPEEKDAIVEFLKKF